MMRQIFAMVLVLVPGIAWADPVPAQGPSSPWAAVTIFAIVIGMIAGVIIWRRRR